MRRREFENTELWRIANLRGQFDGTKMLREFGQGAAAGGVGGLIAGGPVGAGVGALAGGVGYVGQDLIENAVYSNKSDQDKASWQAGDLQEKMEKISASLSDTSPDIAKFLNTLGSSYKEFIDGYVQKNAGVDISRNRFNLEPDQQKNLYMQEFGNVYQRMQRHSASSDYGSGSPTEGYMVGNNTPTNDYSGGMLGGLVSGGAASGFDEATRSTLAPLMENATGLLGKASTPVSFFTGIITDYGIGALAAMYEKKDGVLNYVQSYAQDVEQIITEINSLSQNDPKVVMAGNQIFTYLHWLVNSLSTQQDAMKQAMDAHSGSPTASNIDADQPGDNIASRIVTEALGSE